VDNNTEARIVGAAQDRSCKGRAMSDDKSKEKQFIYYDRRPSLDRLAGVGTPPSGRYFQGYAQQIAVNRHLHALDHLTIQRSITWAKTKGYLSACD
jgi:hypothetical protein